MLKQVMLRGELDSMLALPPVAQLWLQPTCCLCHRPGPKALCPYCWRQLQACGAPTPATLEPEALRVLVWGRYESTLKQAIAALKYEGHRTLADPLGRALGHRWLATPFPTRNPPLIVPIPLHRDRQRERGFNQAELLGKGFCRQTGLTLVSQGLHRQRATAPQFGLGAAARQENLAQAFTLGPGLRRHPSPQPIVLLDDIYTTGTTVRAAAALLRRHGWPVAGVVAISRSQT